MQIDPYLSELSEYSLPDTLFAYVGMVGSTAAMFSLIYFMLWGIWTVVKFFKNIIKA